VELLTVNQVGKLLKIKPVTVRAWIRRGTIPAVRIGAKIIRIPYEEVSRLMQENQSGRNALRALLQNYLYQLEGRLTEGQFDRTVSQLIDCCHVLLEELKEKNK